MTVNSKILYFHFQVNYREVNRTHGIALPHIIDWKLAGRGMCGWRISQLQFHEMSSELQ